MYTLPYIKYTTDKDLQYSTRNYSQYFAISSKGKESEKNRDVCMCVCVCLVAKSCLILRNLMDCSPTRILCPWDFPGKNTGSGCHYHLQGTFPTQGFTPHLLHWQADSLLQSHQGSPDIYITSSCCVCIYIYIKLNHFALHQKLTQHCKSTILQ